MSKDFQGYYNFNVSNPCHNDDRPSEQEEDYQPTENDCGITVKKNGKYIHCITIIGQVEGHYSSSPGTKTTKYEHLIPRIVAVEEDENVSGLLVILNTIGGDVEAGLAIAELICGMHKPKATLVLGGSHSIGIPLAVCADRSFIVPTASMTVHPVRMNGVVIGVPQTLLYLKKMEARVVDFVTRNSHISAERFRQMMLNNNELVSDFGTILDGKQAVEEGLIDQIGGIADAIEFLTNDK